jgi:phytoene dehydrogenase-like protein
VSGGRYGAIVVGAGRNGLVAAAYLARAGTRTLALERRVGSAVHPGGCVSGIRGLHAARAVLAGAGAIAV